MTIELYLVATIENNLTCQIRNACKWNRKQLQNFILSAAIESTQTAHCRKTMTIVTFQNELWWWRAFKTVQFIFVFDGLGWQWASRLKILWVPRRQYTHTFDWKCKCVGEARGPFGAGHDWKQSVQSAKGRRCQCWTFMSKGVHTEVSTDHHTTLWCVTCLLKKQQDLHNHVTTGGPTE